MEQQAFETNVMTGADLLALSENVRCWKKRDCYRQLDAYLHSTGNDRVCLLFGLRRTGKTTMLRQKYIAHLCRCERSNLLDFHENEKHL